jgi:hypothetical protein
MRKRLPDPRSSPLAEVAIVAFGSGVILAFFLSPQILALTEAVLIIMLGVLLFRGRGQP